MVLIHKETAEEWRDVVGYEGYYKVSNLANIYSVRNKRIIRSATIREKNINRERRYAVFTINKKVSRVLLHRVVAMAFCPGYAKGLQVNHIDCNRLNNRADNLEWVTMNENMLHAANNNLLLRGNSHHKARLKELEVIEILSQYKDGKTPNELCKAYNTSNSNVWAIVRGEIWKEVFCRFHGIERNLLSYKKIQRGG